MIHPIALLLAIAPVDTSRLTVVDTTGQPIPGIHVIHHARERLLTATNLRGQCVIDATALRDDDTLRLQGIGYRTLFLPWPTVSANPRVTLHETTYTLDETTIIAVARSSPLERLLERAADKIQRLPRSTPPYCNYHGEARYEKITEYRHRAVEYRREYGYYFTSGNVTPRDHWDARYRAYFLPIYTARTHNIANNGEELLDPIYMTTDDRRFDAGTRKIFTLLRAVMLHGPLFVDPRAHDITLVHATTTEFLYSFRTRPGAYPARTRVSCRGTLAIDPEHQELTRITFDYIDYQMYRQPLLGQRQFLPAPFTTSATITLVHDDDGRPRVASCYQETRWKHDLSEQFLLVEQPSRQHPADGELVEREAFCCDNYRPVPSRLRDRVTTSMIHALQRNPIAPHDSTIFQHLSPLLDDHQALADLSRFAPVEQQYRDNSNKSYYPGNHLKGFNGIERPDVTFHEQLNKLRLHFLSLFPSPSPPGNSPR